MKPILRQWCSLVGSTALVISGCAQRPAETAFTVRQIDTASRANGAVRIKLTTAGDLAEADADLIVTYVKIVAVRVATKRQRQLAEERARATYRKMTTSHQATPKKARYLAVATEKSPSQPGRKAAQSVMIWDTQAQEIVGNNVYDVETEPRIGTVARFETYSAEYVGNGL
jgi:hypothetical protein